MYILKDKQVVAFAKTARESPNYIEIYIEVAPTFRNKKIGSCLLAHMIQRVQEYGKNLLYVAEEDNYASRRIAARNGLKQFNSMVVLMAERQSR